MTLRTHRRIEAAKSGRQYDAKSLALALGGSVSGRDSVVVPGPNHSRYDRSLSVKINPAAPEGLLIHSFAGDDWRTCREHVLCVLGIRRERHSSPRLAIVRTEPEKRKPSEFALYLWREAIPPDGTLAAAYLQSRKLDVPDSDAIRFHPSCPFGKNRQPCMVALYRDILTNEPKAIHRTALTKDGAKIDRKALGPKGGCAIKLTADEDVSSGLTIAEGIETALAGMTLLFAPSWALGDAREVAVFPVLSGIECLTILVDQDKSGTGQLSAKQCSARWRAAGREVFRVVPRATDSDMADVVLGRVA